MITCIRSKDRHGLAVVAVLLVLVLPLAAGAQLDDDRTTESLSRVIPYDGYLNIDGVPPTGALDLAFELSYGDATWSESQTVAATDGEFTVLLGLVEPIPPPFFSAERVWLTIALTQEECLDDVCVDVTYTLTPSQDIVPVPFALWTIQGHDFPAETVLIEGDVSTPAVSMPGDFRAEDQADGQSGDISAATVTFGTLMVNPNGITGDEDLIAGTFSSNGAIGVDGDEIRFGAQTGGFIAQYESTGDQLDFVDEGSITSGLDIIGRVFFEDSVDLLGTNALQMNDQSNVMVGRDGITVNWTIRGNETLFRVEMVSFLGGDETGVNTNIPEASWACWIGGVRIWNSLPCDCDDACGNCETCNDTDLLDVYTYPSDGDWYVRANMRSETGGVEFVQALLLCARNDIVSFTSDGSPSWFAEQ